MSQATAGRVRLLGPVLLEDPDGPVTTTSSLLRTLLALLANRPGEIVGTQTLIDELWGETLPRDPRAALQVQITRLRDWLAQAGIDRAAVRFESRGYVLDIPADHVDLTRFATATSATGQPRDPEAMVATCDAALAEWRDDPFGGCVLGLVLEAEQVRLRERHLRAVERRAEALLALDRPGDAIVDLAGPRRRHPARERLTELTMIALYRAGRQQEALAAYAETRRHLAEEHGLAPGAALVQAEAAILRHDPDLLLAAAGPAPVAAPVAPAPRPLIVGRDEELALVAARLRDREHGAIVVVTGEAGAGKTTLVRAAVHDARAAGAAVGVGAVDDDAPLSAWRDALSELGLDPMVLVDERRSRAVRAALASRARDGGALLVLEDAHGADATSLGVLQGLARLDLPAGLVVVVTARDVDATAHPDWSATAADVARTASTTVVPLGPLTRVHADGLVSARLAGLPADAVARVADDLWTRTVGHALHLTALLDLMEDLGTEADCRAAAEMIPPRLRPLLDHQLGSLPEPARNLVDALAVLGPVAVDDLAAVAGVDPLATLQALRPPGSGVSWSTPAAPCRSATRCGRRPCSTPWARPSARSCTPAGTTSWPPPPPTPSRCSATPSGPAGALPATVRAQAHAAAGRVAFARGAYAEAAELLGRAGAEIGADEEAPSPSGFTTAWPSPPAGGRPRPTTCSTASWPTPTPTSTRSSAAAVGHELLGFRVTGDVRRLARLEEADRLTKGSPARTRIEIIRALLIEESLVHDRPTRVDARAELARLVAESEADLDDAQRARLRAMEGARGRRAAGRRRRPAGRGRGRLRGRHRGRRADADPRRAGAAGQRHVGGGPARRGRGRVVGAPADGRPGPPAPLPLGGVAPAGGDRPGAGRRGRGRDAGRGRPDPGPGAGPPRRHGRLRGPPGGGPAAPGPVGRGHRSDRRRHGLVPHHRRLAGGRGAGPGPGRRRRRGPPPPRPLPRAAGDAGDPLLRPPRDVPGRGGGLDRPRPPLLAPPWPRWWWPGCPPIPTPWSSSVSAPPPWDRSISTAPWPGPPWRRRAGGGAGPVGPGRGPPPRVDAVGGRRRHPAGAGGRADTVGPGTSPGV